MPLGPTTLSIGGVTTTIMCRDDGSEGVVEEVPEEGPRATVLFKCAYELRYKLIKALLGTSLLIGNQVVRTLPYQYPPSPNLYCRTIGEIVGIAPKRDPVSGWLIYEEAYFPATFLPPRWGFGNDPAGGQNDPSGKPWTTTRIGLEGEVFAPPTNTYVWTSGPDAGKAVPDGTVGLIRSKLEFSMTRHWMPYIPLAACMQYKGTVNSASVAIADQTFARGTLLFAGLESHEDFDSVGNMTQEITYKILGNDVDWNQFMDKTGDFHAINTAANGPGNYPFPYTDFWDALP